MRGSVFALISIGAASLATMLTSPTVAAGTFVPRAAIGAEPNAITRVDYYRGRHCCRYYRKPIYNYYAPPVYYAPPTVIYYPPPVVYYPPPIVYRSYVPDVTYYGAPYGAYYYRSRRHYIDW